ncbi:MAG: ribosome maturation factor RimM [Pseudomonadota bacterium]
MSDDLIVVGSIAGAYGVRGEVRIKSFCGVPEDIETYSPLVTQDGRSFHLSLLGRVKNGFSARIVEVVTKEDADALKGVQLCARRDQLPETDEDEFYYADLVGLAVMDTGGEMIGTVKQVLNHGADDLLEVIVTGASDTALIPFTKANVPTVDLKAALVVIDPTGGILP